MEHTLSLLEQLHFIDKSALQLNKKDPDYILDISYNDRNDDPLIATACSNFTIRILSRLRLTTTATLKGHTDTITKVQFSKLEDNLIFSSSRDKTVRCWDTRVNSNKEVHKFTTTPAVSADILCLDTNQSDRLLCAGTEKANKDSYLLFWDRRQASLLGCYNECHQDDITQVCFQPGSEQYLASGSSDGLVCLFDLNETCEDDALQITCNAIADISRIGWCGPQRKEYIYSVTSDYSVFVWGAEEGDLYSSVTDFSTSMNNSAEYIVDCVPDVTAVDDKHSIVLVAGDHSGCVQLATFSDQSFKKLATLSNGHTATIRCSHWDSKTKTLLTGGEDSLVCLWSADSSTQLNADSKKKTGKIMVKSKEMSSAESRKPYHKKKKRIM